MEKQALYVYASEANELRVDYEQLAALLPGAIPESDMARIAVARLESAIAIGLQQPEQTIREVLDQFVLGASRALRKLRDLINAAQDQS